MLQDTDYRENPILQGLPFHSNLITFPFLFLNFVRSGFYFFFYNKSSKLIAKKYINTTFDIFVEKLGVYIIFSCFQVTYTLSSFASSQTACFLALKMCCVVC